MTRTEFVDTTCDSIAAGRKRNYPDIRPSEAAMSRMSDRKLALKVWRGSREAYLKMSREEWLKLLNGKGAADAATS